MSAVRSGMPATANPSGARTTERWSFSPCVSSSGSPKCEMTATSPTNPSPTVSAPPRGSTIGSVSTIAPPPEPATTAPLAYAASTASKTNEPFSTERAWSEEPPGM